MKPDCYKCKHRGNLIGSAHSSCHHPKAEAMYLSHFKNKKTDQELNVVGNPHGIKNGWFMFPYDFDPVWLESCDGFEKKEL